MRSSSASAGVWVDGGTFKMLRTATGLHHQKLHQVPVCSDRMSSSSESDEISGSSRWLSLSQAKPAGWPSHEIVF